LVCQFGQGKTINKVPEVQIYYPTREALYEELYKQAIDAQALNQVPKTADLLHELTGIFKKFLYLPDYRLPTLLALWTLNSYVYAMSDYCGYLWITGPGKRCGKTTLLKLLRSLCSNTTANLVGITAPTLFRIAHAGKTLILDEVENLRSGDHQMATAINQVLNSGFEAGGAVPRVEEVNGSYSNTPKEWKTYSPKAIAGINDIPETAADRSFKIIMRRAKAQDCVKRFRMQQEEKSLKILRDKLQQWAEAYKANGTGSQPRIDDDWEEDNLFEGCDYRLRDIGEPLVAIAQLAKEETGYEDAILKLFGLLRTMNKRRQEEEEDSVFHLILEALDEFLGSKSSDFITLVELKQLVYAKANISISASKLRKCGLTVVRIRLPDGARHRGCLISRSWIDENQGR